MEGKVFLAPKFAIQILAQWRTVSVQNINKAFVKKSKVEERISSQKMLKRFGEEEEEKAQKRFLKKNWSSKTNFWHFSSIPLSLSLSSSQSIHKNEIPISQKNLQKIVSVFWCKMQIKPTCGKNLPCGNQKSLGQCWRQFSMPAYLGSGKVVIKMQSVLLLGRTPKDFGLQYLSFFIIF